MKVHDPTVDFSARGVGWVASHLRGRMIEEVIWTTDHDHVDPIRFVEISDLRFIEVDAFSDRKGDRLTERLGEGSATNRPPRCVLDQQPGAEGSVNVVTGEASKQVRVPALLRVEGVATPYEPVPSALDAFVGPDKTNTNIPRLGRKVDWSVVGDTRARIKVASAVAKLQRRLVEYERLH